ncbi:MAG: FeoA family protein [Alphaproteobacteria bacterium]|nr:FeoA family protein [Alphaproteobacteria bacterium]
MLSSHDTGLDQIALHQKALVTEVRDERPGDPVSQRLRDIGFVCGEEVVLVTRGIFGGQPLLAQIGFTRFALRRSEAKRITVTLVDNSQDGV